MSDYLKIPLAIRLEAFRRNGKKQLGGGWQDENQRWHGVPQTMRQSDACWGGAVFSLGGFQCHWCENLSGYFRETGEAHKLISLRHTGWYVDHNQDEITKGMVLQLPARHGQTLFLAACTDPWNSNAGVVEQYLYRDKATAARVADKLAERYAEDSREHDLKFQAEQQIEELQAAIHANRARIRELVAGIRRSVLDTIVCTEMRATIRRLRSECAAHRRRIAKIEDQPWILLNH